MSAEYFLDTNVLIYSFDASAPEKQRVARGLVRRALSEGIGCISSQVVQEFLNGALHKFRPAFTHGEAADYLNQVLLPLCRIYPSASLFDEALRIHRETQYRMYDSLIVAAAIRSGAARLYSEDLQSGRTIGGLKIVNPFDRQSPES